MTTPLEGHEAQATNASCTELEDIFGDENRAAAAFNVPEDDVSTFPFSGTSDAYMNPATFVRNLYLGNGDNKPWMSFTPGRLAKDFPWMVSLMGNANLTPDEPMEPVADAKNPNWRWAECWRALNTYKVLLKKAEAGTSQYPVKDWLNSFPKNDALIDAMFPPVLKHLLETNEKNIVDKGFAWVGAPTLTPPDTIYPYSGVKVTNASPTNDFKFSQTGAMGQMSVEVAFILATQMAGINWKTLRSKITTDRYKTGVYWISGILPDDKGDRIIEEKRLGLATRSALGYLSRPKNSAGGSPDAGYCLALDIDPDVGGQDRSKSLFLFACHAIDPHSRVYVKTPAALRDMKYVNPYRLNEFTPSQMASKQKDGVRFYGHAHAAVMKSQAWLGWIGQNISPGQHGEKMPDYKQIGEGHLYFLTEDEDAIWPRRTWINANPT